MAGRVFANMSMSLDGYIAGPNAGPGNGFGNGGDRLHEWIYSRRMYDHAEGWGDDPPFHRPVFVLTREKREREIKKGGTTFTFVTDGIESALFQARLLDEIQVDLVPVVLGGGVPLFADIGGERRFEKTCCVDSPAVTHLWFRVAKEGS